MENTMENTVENTEIEDLFGISDVEANADSGAKKSETLVERANNDSIDESTNRKPLQEQDLSESEEVESVESAEKMVEAKATTRPIRPSIGEDSKKRKKRIPIGTQDVLNFKKEPGFHYRVVNDVKNGENIKRYLDAGYEKVIHPKMPGGDDRAGSDSQMGSAVVRSVGGGIYGVLMRQRQDLYDADRLAAQKKINETERALTRQPPPGSERSVDGSGSYGKVEIGQQTNPHI